MLSVLFVFILGDISACALLFLVPFVFITLGQQSALLCYIARMC